MDGLKLDNSANNTKNITVKCSKSDGLFPLVDFLPDTSYVQIGQQVNEMWESGAVFAKASEFNNGVK